MPVALWWMKAALTVVVYAKARSRMLSSAPQPLRVTMRGRGPTNGLAPAATTACSSDSALLRAGISVAPSGARSALTAELSAAARLRPAASGSAPGWGR